MGTLVKILISAIFFNALLNLNPIESHGRMMDPPQRGSMWRVGYDVPKDYNDMSGYCGGIRHLWEVEVKSVFFRSIDFLNFYVNFKGERR